MGKISLGFSSCPNDTFIFDAIVHNKIDLHGLEFEFVIADVEELNQLALSDSIDVSKVSYYTYLQKCKEYSLFNSAGALGFGVGPLLISKEHIPEDEFKNIKIAIPGENTTANLLLSILYPELKHKQSYLFSEIESAILSKEVDAGLIIHENRFTYQFLGLKKLIDLGDKWEQKTKSPIPLGGIIGKQKLGAEKLQLIQEILYASVQFAFDNPESSLTFVRKHAANMNEEVMKKHINLYVNDYSLNLGSKGELAINTLFHQAYVAGMLSKKYKPEIIK